MKRCRQILSVVLLLVYAGQSLLAVGAPCFMQAAPADELNEAMAGMGHAGHDMALAGDDDNGCCEGGYCSMSHCQSSAAMPDTLLCGQICYAPVYHDAFSPSFPEQGLESLYRPPIFC